MSRFCFTFWTSKTKPDTPVHPAAVAAQSHSPAGKRCMIGWRDALGVNSHGSGARACIRPSLARTQKPHRPAEGGGVSSGLPSVSGKSWHRAQGSSHGRKQILPSGLSRRAWKEHPLRPMSAEVCTPPLLQQVPPRTTTGWGRKRKGTLLAVALQHPLLAKPDCVSWPRRNVCMSCSASQKQDGAESLEQSDSKLVTPPCCSQMIFKILKLS